MDANKKIKLMSQLCSILLAVCFLCIFFYYKFKTGDNLMADVFLGAFIGTLSIGFINIISILITHKTEIDVLDNYKNDIAEKVRTIMLCNIGFDAGTFDQVIKKTLVPGDYSKIDILAHTSERFLNILNRIDFSCTHMRIFIQEININVDPIINDWKKFYRNKKGRINLIEIYKSQVITNKLICGMVINNNQSGVMGFYSPNTVEILNVFGINSEIPRNLELLNVIDQWFDYYLRNTNPVLTTIPDQNIKNGIKV
jgi:hypothetical protein